MKIKKSVGERIFDVFNVVFLILLALTTLYPFVLIISGSISDLNAIIRNEIVLFPVGFSLDGYKNIISDGQILVAYGNTIFYTVFGTIINLVVTLAAAYPLSRKSYRLRGPIMFLFSATMFFGGGLVPFYLLIQNLAQRLKLPVCIPAAGFAVVVAVVNLPTLSEMIQFALTHYPM